MSSRTETMNSVIHSVRVLTIMVIALQAVRLMWLLLLLGARPGTFSGLLVLDHLLNTLSVLLVLDLLLFSFLGSLWCFGCKGG